MSISVIIATFNRAESLRRTLQTLCAVNVPGDIKWEVLVVDNNSTDHTKTICKEFSAQLPLQYLFEPIQGKSHALNRGIEKASFDLLLFTDDDVDIDRQWIYHYWQAFLHHPEVSILGGRIYPSLAIDVPGWFLAHATGMLSPASGYFDRGEEERLINTTFLGANMALRKSLFSCEAGYCHNVSIIANSPGCIRGAEENEIQSRLIRKGHKALYVPSAIINHRLLHQPCEAYVRSTFKAIGVNEVRLGEVRMQACLFKVPMYYWKLLLLNSVKYILTRWAGPERVWLSAEINVASAWGVVCECRFKKDESLPSDSCR